MLRDVDHVLVLRQVCAVNYHAAAGHGQREERLSHRPYPDHRILELLPARREHEAVALGNARQERHAHREHEEDDEEQRHHHLVCLFDAVRAEKQRQQRTGNHDDMIRHDRVRLRRKLAEPRRSVGAHKRPGQGVDQRLENVGDYHGVAYCDAQRACKRQPAEHGSCLTAALAARRPRAFVCSKRAGGGSAPHCEFRRQPDIAEDEYEQQVDQKKCAAAVAAHFIREAPDVRHTDRRADGCEDEAPAACEARCIFLHFFSRCLL